MLFLFKKSCKEVFYISSRDFHSSLFPPGKLFQGIVSLSFPAGLSVAN